MATLNNSEDASKALSNQVDNLCENCHENKLEMEPLPHEYTGDRHIKLFGWVIMFYRNKSKPIDGLCSFCLIDRSHADEYDRIAPALSDAYEKGYKDAQSERHGY